MPSRQGQGPSQPGLPASGKGADNSDLIVCDAPGEESSVSKERCGGRGEWCVDNQLSFRSNQLPQKGDLHEPPVRPVFITVRLV